MELVQNVGIFYLMSFVQSALFAYFLSEYLECENKRKRFIKIFIVFSIINFFAAIFYQYVVFKSGMMLVLFIVSMLFWFKDYSAIKKFIAFMLLLTLSFFSEMLVDALFFLVHGYLNYTKVSQLEFVAWQLGVDVFLFIMSNFVIKYIKLKTILNKTENIILILLMFSHILFIYATMMSLVDNGFEKILVGYFYNVLLVLIFISHIFLIIILYKNYEKKVNEMTLLKLKNEYEKQLVKYLNSNNHEMRHLRHDILNFIENQKKEN